MGGGAQTHASCKDPAILSVTSSPPAVAVSPEVHVLEMSSPKSHVNCTWRWGFGEWLGFHEVMRGARGGICGFLRRGREP